MAEKDLLYYSRRAEAERVRAEHSASPEQRRSHEELRRLYLARSADHAMGGPAERSR